MPSGRHQRSSHRGLHRKPGRTVRIAAAGATAAAGTIMLAGFTAAPATAAEIPQPETIGAVENTAHLAELHLDHVIHQRHLDHLAYLDALHQQQEWAREHPPVITTTADMHTNAPAAHSPSGGYSVNSSFQACVIARESGGNAQVMNSTAHYGLYQFDYGTWVSGGGNPADFGHASVEEQNRVFSAVYAARGTSPWGPYDGC